MTDDILTMYAGRVMGYGESGLRFFVPLESDFQSAQLAKKLVLHITIDFVHGVTLIEHRNTEYAGLYMPVVTKHSDYNGDANKATRYGVVSVAAEIGRNLPPVIDRPYVCPKREAEPKAKGRKSGVKSKNAVAEEGLAVG